MFSTVLTFPTLLTHSLEGGLSTDLYFQHQLTANFMSIWGTSTGECIYASIKTPSTVQLVFNFNFTK